MTRSIRSSARQAPSAIPRSIWSSAIRTRFEVLALTANGNAAELAQAAHRNQRQLAVVADDSALPALQAALAGSGIERGRRACVLIEAAAQLGADMTMAAIVGCAGLAPTMAALEAGQVRRARQ